MKMQMLETALDFLSKLFYPLALYLIHRYVKSKRLAEALSYMSALTATAVMELKPLVRDLKDPTKPGQWNAEVAKQMKALALATVQRGGGTMLRVLQQSMEDPKAINTLLSSMVEAEVERHRDNLLVAQSLDTEEGTH